MAAPTVRMLASLTAFGVIAVNVCAAAPATGGPPGTSAAPAASATRAPPAASYASAADDRTAVYDAAARFLTAFQNLDMPAFIACFADDATVFFPQPEPAARFDGKAAIQAHFQQVFEAIRAAATGGPPYQTLTPEQLEIQMLGSRAAIVSFHLRNAQRTARRTLIFSKVGHRWLIEHLHASNVPRDSGP